MIPTLHIHLLGDFLLLSGDTPVTTVAVPRLQSLLAYLVLHRTAPQDRSHLAFLLWPDSTEAQTHTNLRKLLYQLRHAFPDTDYFLLADKHSLQWKPTPDDSWTLDVLDFEQALAQAEQAEQAQDTTAMRQALAQEKIADAINYARMLLDPALQPPPEQLSTLLVSARRAWDAGQQEEARALLQQAAPPAEQMGYL